MGPQQADLYLCSLPAASSSFAAFPVFLAPPSPWPPALSSASPPTPFASGSPEELAVEDREKNISPYKNQKPQCQINYSFTRSARAERQTKHLPGVAVGLLIKATCSWRAVDNLCKGKTFSAAKEKKATSLV